MNISEIFYSIQGEGRWTGLPNIFIRTAGCNLRCSYCDTKYAYSNGKTMQIQKILQIIQQYPCKLVCITGGEPLLQKKTLELIALLQKNKFSLLIETNGSFDIKPLTGKEDLLISLDMKCPSSGMQNEMRFENIVRLSSKDQLKFVISNKTDYAYAKKIISKYTPFCQIFFQPVWGSKQTKLSEWILKDGLDVRIGLQIHKILFGNKRRT